MVAKRPKRIALWSGPRDIATGMLYSFAQRDDATVSDEPLFGYYLGFSGIEIPFRKQVLEKMEIDPVKIIDMLVNCDLNKEILFIKNKSDQAVGLQWDFMTSFDNVFLISHPKRMILSNDQEKEEQQLLDTCYEVQYHQILYLIQLGIEPIVIDSDDLIKNPDVILSSMCAKLGIPFQSKMLKWEKSEKEVESLPSRNWCKNMHNTSSFKDVDQLSGKLSIQQEELLEECLPFYERIQKYAIKA